MAEQQVAIEGRVAELTEQYNAAVRLTEQLETALQRAGREAAETQEVRRVLQVRAAGLQRQLDRARNGGRQVAVEAEAMYGELCGASE